MGGFPGLDSVEYLHPEDGSWQTAAATLPTTAYRLRATNIDDRILIFGVFGSVRSSSSNLVHPAFRLCVSPAEVLSRSLNIHPSLSGSLGSGSGLPQVSLGSLSILSILPRINGA